MNNHPKILAIDDEPINLEIVAAIFNGLEYELQTAATGSDGLQMVYDLNPNVVLLDIMLPDISGYDICREIRANNAYDATKFILVSGKAEIDERIDGYEAGADDYVTKPFLSAELLAKVNVFSKLSMSERNLVATVSNMQEEVQDKNDKLLQSDKLSSIGLLTTGIAHEINNPIGYISSNLHTLTEYFQVFQDLLATYAKLDQPGLSPTTAAMQKILNDIRDIKLKEDYEFIDSDIANLLATSISGLQKIREISSGLKTFSHKSESYIEEIDLNCCIESVVKILSNELKYKCTLNKHYGELKPLLCYPNQLSQVFMNILVNATHAIEEMGEIAISTRDVDGIVEVEITDTGSGIAKESLPALFEPFYTTKPVGIGTGLGLSISLGIIQKHGGTIDVVSELGKGTTFTITLPYDGVNEPDEVTF